MKTYRIEELATAAHTTVRNIRAYQDRGLLPPPQREGRIAWYSDAHLARLRIVSTLLERGYSIANIGELINAWESGNEIGDLLGLEHVIASPFSDEEPVAMKLTELIAMFGTFDPLIAAKAIRVGLVELRLGGGVNVPSTRLLKAGAELAKAGVPLRVLLDELEQLRRDVDTIAGRFVDIVVNHILHMKDGRLPPGQDTTKLTELIRRIRPLAVTIVTAQLALSLEKGVRARVGDELARLFQRTNKKGTPKG